MLKKLVTAAAAAMLTMASAFAAITDGRFSTAQIWDVQYGWNGTTLNASWFQNLYASVNYDTQATSASRLTDAQIADASANGRYFAFFDSTTNPGTYGLALYESDGTLYKVINHTGTFTALGDGAIFYLGNGSWGTVITIEGGYSKNDSASFTTMDRSVDATKLSNYTYTNTTPLAAGQTYSGTPTVVSTTAGTPTVTSSSSTGATVITNTVTNGTTVRAVTTAHAVSEDTITQTVDTTVTTVDTTPVTTIVTNTTPVTTTTCTTPTTVTTYSDNSTTTANGTQSCSVSTTNTVTTSSSTVDLVQTSIATAQAVGRIDQLATAQDITNSVARGIEFDGIKAIGISHVYKNGLEGRTKGITVGGKRRIENGIIIGGGIAELSTNVNNQGNSASADTRIFDGSIGKELEKGTVEVGLTHVTSDYLLSRTIGSWANAGATSGTDTSARISYELKLNDKVTPVIGYTRGQRKTDAYTETGDIITARAVANTNTMYDYATVGAKVDLGLVDFTMLHHSDGVNQASIGLVKEDEKVNWEARLSKSTSALGDNTTITAGFNVKF